VDTDVRMKYVYPYVMNNILIFCSTIREFLNSGSLLTDIPFIYMIRTINRHE